MTVPGSVELEACLKAVEAVSDATESLDGFFRRHERELTDRDRACAEAIRPLLCDLCRMARDLEARAAWGVPPPTIPVPRTDPLTAREREVLQCLCGGKTDCDIARILGISPRTVHKHLQRIYEKLGVETRTAAVSRYFFSTTTRPSFT